MINYKKILKSRKLREFILNCLWFIPDAAMIKMQYRIKTGRKLNLSNARRYSEKMQLYKLYCRTSNMRFVVDKDNAKKYVADQGYSDIVIPTFGVYEKANCINLENLPNKFVAKDTLGGGGSSVIICKDKSLLDSDNFMKTIKSWLKRSSSYKNGGREWVYGGKHRVIIEEYLEHDDVVGLIDYKFLCFNGHVEYLYIISNRVLGKSAELGIYDRDLKKIDAFRVDEKAALDSVAKPKNYEKMLEIAENLAKPFSYARVDLYNINGKIYFGEITLTDGSGYMTFDPDSFDYTLGEKWQLELKRD